MVWYLPLKLSFIEDGLTADTGLKIKMLLWHWQINKPTFDPLCPRNGVYFSQIFYLKLVIFVDCRDQL